MLGRQERTAIFLLVGVAIIVLVAHFVISSIGMQAFAKPFSATTPDGELVSAEGTISKVTVMNGGHVMILADNNSIFVPAPVAQGLKFQTGDRISVNGIVQTYHAKKEIAVGSQNDIRFTRQAH